MTRATAIIAVLGAMALSIALAACANGNADEETVPERKEYLPLESYLENNTSHLRFRTGDGHATLNAGGVLLFVKTDGGSEMSTTVHPERIDSFRLDLHMADEREFSQGDVVEVTIEGQFPDSPARFGAVVENVDIFYGKSPDYTQREYMEYILSYAFGKDHVLYTVAVQSRT